MAKPDPFRRTFGRRIGRPLGKNRAEVLEALLPSFSIPENRLTEKHDLNPEDIFSAPCAQYWMEIGFGSGEHISSLMRRHPDYGWIGAEPFINGVAALLKDISPDFEAGQPCNLRLLNDDAMRIALSLQEKTLDGIYILNPDPWPKKRHNNRRIVNPLNLDVFAKIIKSGGALILSTDVPDLADWMIMHTSTHPAFEWTAKTAQDWRTPPPDWIPTRYEVKKARHGEQMCYLFFVRK
ncbi:MAG: tRNA (guanosine(46)-N7)-methyltransferase TrmB [Alphaproteobacteria bacterium]|nr:tRNA (guanosine(46)-N7)-methyltransferase TrmB [Alphaproteobacteria bacterium]